MLTIYILVGLSLSLNMILFIIINYFRKNVLLVSSGFINLIREVNSSAVKMNQAVLDICKIQSETLIKHQLALEYFNSAIFPLVPPNDSPPNDSDETDTLGNIIK